MPSYRTVPEPITTADIILPWYMRTIILSRHCINLPEPVSCCGKLGIVEQEICGEEGQANEIRWNRSRRHQDGMRHRGRAGQYFDRAVFPTETPEITVPKMIEYFQDKGIEALGIGCFGPVDLNRKSATYGYITSTPKLAWRFYDFAGAFREALQIPVGFDTDVNGAVLGEVRFGAAKGCENALYMTIGTGVGVGAYINGKLLHGLMHPEGGHIFLQKHPEDTYAGCCPYHGACLEGLASGLAIQGRYGKKGAELSGRDDVWELESYYIGQAVADYMMTYSPEKIILWGGVMHQEKVFDMVRKNAKEFLNGYLPEVSLPKDLSQYIVAPALGENPGIIGALCLAQEEMVCSR